MEGVQLLLLIDLSGHIPAHGYQLSDTGVADILRVGLMNGCDVQLEIAMTW